MNILRIPILGIAAVLLALSSALWASAQTTIPDRGTTSPSVDSSTSTAITTENQGQADRPTTMSQSQRQNGTELTPAQQKRVINLAANISNRVDAAVRRLNNIANRLDSRLHKMADRGIDTTQAQAHVTTARTTLDNISARMNTIDTIVYNSATSDRPHEAWQNVRVIFQGVQADLLSAREALRAAIDAAKQAPTAVDSEPISSSTDSTVELVN